MPTLRPRKPNKSGVSPTAASSSLPETATTTTTTTTEASVSSAVPSSSSTALKKRGKRAATGNEKQQTGTDIMPSSDEERALLGDGPDAPDAQEGLELPESVSWARRNQWILFALASGACAAFNGVFAKLTTTELTTSLSLAVSRFLGLESIEKVIEFAVRGSFFGLNLVFNGIMWTLFTTALARGNSTTQVSIMNTSSNFVITAILGFAIFSEALPPLWWLGAAMLVAGNVIVGRKDESPLAKDGEEVRDQDADVALSSGIVGVGMAGAGTERRVDGPAGQVEEEFKDEDVADLRL